ncbi:MAG: SDR family NAD(P)-dependent oxidoreductase [Halanaerobiales bacterium]|nr:SDR family NAD(P)-dependent oxidoreductase [Halanaerobiales bacterium]
MLSFEDGFRTTYYRAMALNQIEGKKRGGMISISTTQDDPVLRKVFAGVSDYYTISLVNAPDQIVVSGDLKAIREIEKHCEEEKIGGRVLPVSHAFHSELLRPALAYFEEKLKLNTWNAPKVSVLSTINGQIYDKDFILSGKMPAFLASQLVTPFSFMDTIKKIFKDFKIRIYIEVGPRDILTKLVKKILDDEEIISICSNKPSLGDLVSFDRLKAYLKVHKVIMKGREDMSSIISVKTDADLLKDELLRIANRYTGYPHSVIDFDKTLHMGLAINSFTLSDIVSHIRKEYELSEDELSNVKEITLREIFEIITEKKGISIEVAPALESKKVEANISHDEVSETVYEIIQAKTGYPADMLEGDFDLEADLGIDSVKQAEIIGQVREKYVFEQREDINIKDLNTINKIIEFTMGQVNNNVERETSFIEKEKLDPKKVIEELYTGEDKTLRYVSVTMEKVYDETKGKPFKLEGKNFVIVEDQLDGNLTKELVKLLQEKNVKVCVVADSSNTYEVPTVQINWSDDGEIGSGLLRTFQEAKNILNVVHGMINLYSLKEISMSKLTPEEWSIETEKNFRVQFFASKVFYSDWEKSELECGCFGATNIGGVFGLESSTSDNPMGALLAGFFKSLQKELDVTAKIVDFTILDSPADVAKILIKEFSLNENLIEIGYTERRRKTIQVIPKKLDIKEQSKALDIDDNSVIIVSGGGRGIIYECVKGLAKLHNPHIIITGRTSIPTWDEDWIKMSEEEFVQYRIEFLKKMKRENPKATPILIEREYVKLARARKLYSNLYDLQQQNYKVSYVACDVADREAVKILIKDIKKKYGKIDGIVHGAGLESFGSIPKKPVQHTLNVVRVKVNGMYNLYNEIKDDSIKFFINFGSISGRFGMDGLHGEKLEWLQLKMSAVFRKGNVV